MNCRSFAAAVGTGYRAHNAAHGLAIEFGPASLKLRSKDGMAWRLEMRLVGYGYGESVRLRANGRQG